MSKSSDRNPSNDPSPLKILMDSRGYKSYKQLCSQSGISMKQLRKIRKGQVNLVRLGILLTLAQVFKISFLDLLAAIAPENATLFEPQEFQDGVKQLRALQAEYQYLQQQQSQAIQEATLTCQTEALSILEPWLQYWPVAAKAAQENPAFLANKLIPLCRPIETLLERWHVNAIAPIGSQISYDPKLHQLMDEETEVGQLVQVRYPGYMYQGKLHFRAKVSPAHPTT